MNKHDKQGQARGLSRRSVLKAGAAMAGMAALGTAMPLRAQARGISVTCWGGSYEAAVRQAFAEPFAKESGIPVTLVNSADLTRMKVQVDSGNVSWDVFDSIGPQIMAGSRQGLWTPIDTGIVDTSKLLQPAGKDYVGSYSYAGGIAYDPKKFPDGKHPETFADFWDLKRYPGRRGLRSRVSENLEMALLADGVPPAQLYPLDVERAFKAMDRIKPAVRKWIETTPETVTLLTSNEIDFSYSYLSRVLPAQRAGSSVAMSMRQTLNSLEYLAVPKGGKNIQNAMRYVAFCLRPERQAAFCELVEFAPNAAGASDMVGAQARARMPDMKSPDAIIINDAWWGENYDKLQRRFTEWLLV
ncbi:spermidine/putrescine ABC transporter substrate-binding protein [Bordetella genomosp. 8]|uniref:Spermidine/putrescine ABC transporter substrate-binding protein n=1 Tax=Bordetella genomosp. 8 TaxID=1416806 RepID=A0A1W6YFC5_9BORD|nr:ABC transporter substrate-binding protein [Bordetella genomosp. 8]ARP79785.1 spermidine/putrescine ABC transporter substrate-binding protein [Bordetella genomosp. 8]